MAKCAVDLEVDESGGKRPAGRIDDLSTGSGRKFRSRTDCSNAAVFDDDRAIPQAILRGDNLSVRDNQHFRPAWRWVS